MGNRPIRRNLRTPGARAIRRLVAALDESAGSGVPVEEVLGVYEQRDAAEARRRELVREERAERAVPGMSRREFLSGAAAAGAVVALGPLSQARPARAAAPSRTAPRIVIVGAGLAGIRCAHDLWTERVGGGGGLATTVYEADTTHVGGRCWSLRGYFSNGLVGEHGGAFINTDQRATRRLADSLGLEQERMYGGALPGLKDIYWFDNLPYTYAEASEDWKSFGHRAFRDAFRHAPYPQLYNRQTPGGVRIDHQSVPEWLDRIGIGADSRFGRLMQANAVSEYGGNPGEQSALNLLYLLAWNPRDQLDPLPGYDEMFHIVGGNDQLVSGMIGQLPAGTVRQGNELVALRRKGSTYRLTFDTGGGALDVDADHVVLALPFTKLRDVDLSKAGLSPLKMRAIRDLPLGQNAKIHVQVDRKTWPKLGYNGSAYTDWKDFCVCWDDSVALGRHGAPAILLGFPGGSTGESVLTGQAHGPAPAGDVSWFLDQVEPIFPGTKAAYSGIAWEDHWAVDPWHLGAYSYWKVGQSTSFAGYEGVQEGTVHFAGEHTEWDDQGFLDGAVVSGERVAKEIRHQT